MNFTSFTRLSGLFKIPLTFNQAIFKTLNQKKNKEAMQVKIRKTFSARFCLSIS